MTHQGRAAGETRAELADRLRDVELRQQREQDAATIAEARFALERAVPAAPLDVERLATALQIVNPPPPLYVAEAEAASGATCDWRGWAAAVDREYRAALAPSAGSSGTAEVERLRKRLGEITDWFREHPCREWDDFCTQVGFSILRDWLDGSEQPSHPAAPDLCDDPDWCPRWPSCGHTPADFGAEPCPYCDGAGCLPCRGRGTVGPSFRSNRGLPPYEPPVPATEAAGKLRRWVFNEVGIRAEGAWTERFDELHAASREEARAAQQDRVAALQIAALAGRLVVMSIGSDCGNPEFAKGLRRAAEEIRALLATPAPARETNPGDTEP